MLAPPKKLTSEAMIAVSGASTMIRIPGHLGGTWHKMSHQPLALHFLAAPAGVLVQKRRTRTASCLRSCCCICCNS